MENHRVFQVSHLEGNFEVWLLNAQLIKAVRDGSVGAGANSVTAQPHLQRHQHTTSRPGASRRHRSIVRFVSRVRWPQPTQRDSNACEQLRWLEGLGDVLVRSRLQPRQAVLRLGAGDRLLLYTDGLVERRDVNLDDRQRRSLEISDDEIDIPSFLKD